MFSKRKTRCSQIRWNCLPSIPEVLSRVLPSMISFRPEHTITTEVNIHAYTPVHKQRAQQYWVYMYNVHPKHHSMVIILTHLTSEIKLFVSNHDKHSQLSLIWRLELVSYHHITNLSTIYICTHKSLYSTASFYNAIGQFLWKYSTLEHDFYKFTTTIKSVA